MNGNDSNVEKTYLRSHYISSFLHILKAKQYPRQQRLTCAVESAAHPAPVMTSRVYIHLPRVSYSKPLSVAMHHFRSLHLNIHSLTLFRARHGAPSITKLEQLPLFCKWASMHHSREALRRERMRGTVTASASGDPATLSSVGLQLADGRACSSVGKVKPCFVASRSWPKACVKRKACTSVSTN